VPPRRRGPLARARRAARGRAACRAPARPARVARVLIAAEEERVARGEAHEGRFAVLHRHQPARPHHAVHLRERGRQLRVGQVLSHVGAPHPVERGVGIREGGQGADPRLDRAGQRPTGHAGRDGGDILRGEVERREPPAGPDEFRQERQEGPAAASGVEDAPAGSEADAAGHRLVLGAAGLEMLVEPLAGRHRLPGRRGVALGSARGLLGHGLLFLASGGVASLVAAPAAAWIAARWPRGCPRTIVSTKVARSVRAIGP
jgi:hypothetical protein